MDGSALSDSPDASGESGEISHSAIAAHFPLPWSHYVKLLTVQDIETRSFDEKEALRCGWSVRQLDRQMASRFYERALLSKSKAALLEKPLGLILCAQKDAAVARYALEGLPNKALAAEYRMALPDEAVLAEELRRTQNALLHRSMPGLGGLGSQG